MVNNHYIYSKRVSFNIKGGVEIDNELDLVTGAGSRFVESHEGRNKKYKDLNDLNKLLGGGNENERFYNK